MKRGSRPSASPLGIAKRAALAPEMASKPLRHHMSLFRDSFFVMRYASRKKGIVFTHVAQALLRRLAMMMPPEENATPWLADMLWQYRRSVLLTPIFVMSSFTE